MAVEKIHEITGSAVPVRGDDIDTDRIIPARFLKSITFEGLEQHLFEDDRLQSPSHPLSNPVYRSARIMLLRHALSLDSEASAVEAAVGAAISAPRRTRDIGGIASCSAVAEAVAQQVKRA